MEKEATMKIHEVEQAVGITRRNIRFYEKEGLLNPSRNLENGYREYSGREIAELKKIKLLRKLSVPLEEIRAMQEGRLVLSDGLGRHLIVLNRERETLEQMQHFCRHILDQGEQLASMDVDRYLAEMDQIEEEGMRFLNLKQVDTNRKKWTGALLAGGVMMVLCLWMLAYLIWAFFQDAADAPPLFLLALLFAFPVISLVCLIYALVQRKRELEKGEEDAAAKY